MLCHCFLVEASQQLEAMSVLGKRLQYIIFLVHRVRCRNVAGPARFKRSCTPLLGMFYRHTADCVAGILGSARIYPDGTYILSYIARPD